MENHGVIFLDSLENLVLRELTTSSRFASNLFPINPESGGFSIIFSHSNSEKITICLIGI